MTTEPLGPGKSTPYVGGLVSIPGPVDSVLRLLAKSPMVRKGTSAAHVDKRDNMHADMDGSLPGWARWGSLLVVLTLAGCTAAGAPQEEPDRNLATQEQAIESDEDRDGDEIGLVSLNCPEDTASFRLQLQHTFSFTPGNQPEEVRFEGHTTPDAWCLVNVTGSRVEAEECVVGYEYSGSMGGGRCEFQGTSTAVVRIEGECMPGNPDHPETAGTAEVYLVITEFQNPHAGLGGVLVCEGGFSEPYLGVYAPSMSVMSFGIERGGSSDVDNGTDPSGYFQYQKRWTLIPAGYPFD